MGKQITVQKGRDAKTGEFVTIDYAKKHPATTVIETVKIPIQQKKKK